MGAITPAERRMVAAAYLRSAGAPAPVARPQLNAASGPGGCRVCGEELVRSGTRGRPRSAYCRTAGPCKRFDNAITRLDKLAPAFAAHLRTLTAPVHRDGPGCEGLAEGAGCSWREQRPIGRPASRGRQRRGRCVVAGGDVVCRETSYEGRERAELWFRHFRLLGNDIANYVQERLGEAMARRRNAVPQEETCKACHVVFDPRTGGRPRSYCGDACAAWYSWVTFLDQASFEITQRLVGEGQPGERPPLDAPQLAAEAKGKLWSLANRLRNRVPPLAGAPRSAGEPVHNPTGPWRRPR